MNENKQQHLTFVIFDGIFNSVFKSQVLTPLLQLIERNEQLHVTLVSFEFRKPEHAKLVKLIPAHDRFHFILGRRFPYVGRLGLVSAVHQYVRLLELLPVGQIIARGPIAGYVVLQAVKRYARKNPGVVHVSPVTVQARGLCAQEYRYIHRTRYYAFLKNPLFGYIYCSLTRLERVVFGAHKDPNKIVDNVTIEAVSPALKEYLIDTFQADPARIDIAVNDVPREMSKEQVTQWRHEVRLQLQIPEDTTVYCYSGSYKPWQCVTETIDYFCEKLELDDKSFLLVLTTDLHSFRHELVSRCIPEDNFAVLSVDPFDLYRYLSAADYGMLFREKDIINWVSRPTKMLEYQAVGLQVLHNDTVAWLKNQYKI